MMNLPVRVLPYFAKFLVLKFFWEKVETYILLGTWYICIPLDMIKKIFLANQGNLTHLSYHTVAVHILIWVCPNVVFQHVIAKAIMKN